MKVFLVMAMTADGKIAKTDNHFPDWTSKEDKKFFHKISEKAGVVIMGDKTFFTFSRPLKNRLNVVFTPEKNPKKIEGVRWVKGSPEKILTKLEKEGYKKVILGGGAFINGMFLEKKLVDEIIITIEPKIFGDGLGLFRGDFDVNLKLKKIEKINKNSVLLRYQVLK